MTSIGSMAMSPTQMATQMQERFKTADSDENGSMSREEFMANASEDRDSGTIDKMFERLDADGDGEISQAEQQAMIDQMAERAQKMADMKAAGGGGQDMFASLLETLSDDEEEDSQMTSFIDQIQQQLESGNMSQQDLAKSMMEINRKIPRINTTA